MKTIEMDPLLAKVLLRTCKRKPSPNLVDNLVGRIKSNRWNPNYGAIVLKEGKVVDGLHRLHAIVKAGKAVPVYLVEC